MKIPVHIAQTRFMMVAENEMRHTATKINPR